LHKAHRGLLKPSLPNESSFGSSTFHDAIPSASPIEERQEKLYPSKEAQ